MFKSLRLRTKLVISFLLAGVIPIVLVGVISYLTATQTINSQASNQLKSVSEIKRQGVLRYFQTIHDQIITFSQDLMIVEAMTDFKASFSNFVSENNLTNADISRMNKELKTYYDDEFSEEYRRRNDGASPAMSERYGMLDNDSIALQYHYIKANPKPLGSKEELDASPDSSTYSRHHSRYHPVIRDYLRRFGYYDIFLCDLETGDIIYSVFKELDYSTSLSVGPYSNTNFGRAFQAAKELNKNDALVLVDYESYTPSYEDPASFIASPIFDGNRKIGVAIFQMPIDRLNEIMGEREGLGESGETYIVGSDYHVRSDSYRDPENRSVTSSFRKPELGKIQTETVDKALRGEDGVATIHNYLGEEVLSSYRPIEIEGHNWALVAEIKTAEAFEGANSLVLILVLVTAGVTILVLGFSLLFARSIVRPINETIKLLIKGTDETAGIAAKVAQSSEEISGDVTNINRLMREAESTLANLSTMTSTNADNAIKVSEIAGNTKESADSGNEAMQRLNSAIEAIKDSSEQTSNIIKTIDEIAFQTNLLALNAAVEAARAGEAGKGFAVVAEEVRSLATRSADAARGTGDLLKNAREQAENGVEVSKELGTVLATMIDDIGKVNVLIDEVSHSSGSQASDINETTQAVQEISNVIMNTRTSSEANTSAGVVMNEQAKQLKEVVARLISIVYGVDLPADGNVDAVTIQNKMSNLLREKN